MRFVPDWFKGKTVVEPDTKALSTQIAVESNDGAITLDNNVTNSVLSFDWTANTQADLINTYRDCALIQDVDYAIQDIIQEMVSFSEDEEPVVLDLEGVEGLSDSIKLKIHDKFEKIAGMLHLSDTIHQRAQNFYIDGRIAYQKVVDPSNLKKGLIGIVELDPMNVTKVRNIKYSEGTRTITGVEEYYIYDEKGANVGAQTKTKTVDSNRQYKEALQLNSEMLTYITSGLIDPKTGFTLSYLHKAVKPANQLRIMENSLVIYRITRAPERRVFYIDVGNLPKNKAEQYLSNLQASFRNKMAFDPDKGTFKDQRHLMTMQEDFWLPRSSSGKGTEVTTLPGGANLDSIEDILYFLKRLYKSLNIPVSRLEPDAMASLGGRSEEINRDELKFSKFVSKLRKRFNMMFKDLLRTELLLSNIITQEEWEDIESQMRFVYAQDQYLEERKFFEMTRDRINLANDMMPYVGKFFSNAYIRTEILRQSDDIQTELNKEIKEEASDPQYKEPEEEQSPS